jgi:hypothetical protein
MTVSPAVEAAGAAFDKVKDDLPGQKDSSGRENLFGKAQRLSHAGQPTRRRTMDYTLIRYGVTDTSLAENRALVTKVFMALEEAKPQTVRYLVLELDNGEFIHVVSQDKDTSALTGLAAFKAFSADHAERRSAPVARSPARIVGKYRMLAGGR